MSGFVLIINRDGSPVDPTILHESLARIVHRGHDGSDILIKEGVAFGHQHFWTTPEQVGERQPLVSPDGRYTLLMDGRLDNRPDLMRSLALYDETLSDAALVLEAYRQWGRGCFEHLLGPFALAIYDHHERTVILARDVLGSRTLYYHLNNQILIVASEPYAVLAHPIVSADLNEDTLIRWYAARMPVMGDTFFKDIDELFPAHVMAIRPEQVETRCYWQADPSAKIRYKSDQEYADHYRSLLEDSIRCRLRSTTPTAVVMSGGYDSTSVAAIAARELKSRGERLHTISWTFDELSSCDERSCIEAVNVASGTEAHYFSADDAWPLHDWENWPHTANYPERNPYRHLWMRAYDEAKSIGCRTVMTGGFGNYLFGGSAYWLIDLLRDKRFGDAIGSLIKMRQGRSRAWADAGLRRIAGLLLDTLPGGRRIRPKRKVGAPGWLTPSAAESYAQLTDGWPPSEDAFGRPNQYGVVLGVTAATNYATKSFYGGLAGVEVRHPYRDRRLVEFMLAIPAHQLYQQGLQKFIVYNAMAGILPDSVRNAQSLGNLLPLYTRGILEREREKVQTHLHQKQAVHQHYIQQDAVASIMEKRLPSHVDGADILVPWQIVAFESWLKRFEISFSHITH